MDTNYCKLTRKLQNLIFKITAKSCKMSVSKDLHSSCSMDACTNIVCAAKGNKRRRIITCYGLTAMGTILSTPDQIRYKSVWTQRMCTIYHIPHDITKHTTPATSHHVHPHQTKYQTTPYCTMCTPHQTPHNPASCTTPYRTWHYNHTTLHKPHQTIHTIIIPHITTLHQMTSNLTILHRTSHFTKPHITSHQTTPKHTPHHLEET